MDIIFNRSLLVAVLYMLSLTHPVLKYWEDYSKEEQEIIQKGLSDTTGVAFFLTRPWPPSDDERTIRLMDILTKESSQPGEIALFFYVFNKICLLADGALAEVIGGYCCRMILVNPDFTLYYLFSVENAPLMERYTLAMGYTFAYDRASFESLSSELMSSVRIESNRAKLPSLLMAIKNATELCEVN